MAASGDMSFPPPLLLVARASVLHRLQARAAQARDAMHRIPPDVAHALFACKARSESGASFLTGVLTGSLPGPAADLQA